jgi:hypothetical protein
MIDRMRTPLHTRLLWIPFVSLSCGGSLSHYPDRPDRDGVDPVDTDDVTVQTQDDTGDPTQTTDPTDTTTTTDPAPDCDRPADCDDPRCDDACDNDGDGEITEDLGGRDCNDRDDEIHPGADDVCDRKDNDCDGTVDDDSDRDGYDVCDDCDDDTRSVHPGANDACNGTDSNCDGEDCDPWEEDFEANGMGANWVQTGAVTWYLGEDWAHRGLQSSLSGNIGNSESSILTLTVDITSPGSVTFFHKGVTESGYDKLLFKIDGAQQGQWSGNWGWTQESYPLTVGVHDLQWTYRKDGSQSQGADQVAIDDVEIENGRPL